MDFSEQTPLLGRNGKWWCTRQLLINCILVIIYLALLVPYVVGAILTTDPAPIPCSLTNATADNIVTWLTYASWINLPVSVFMYWVVVFVSSFFATGNSRNGCALLILLQMYSLFVAGIFLSGIFVQLVEANFQCGTGTTPLLGLYAVSSLVTFASFLQWVVILLVLDINPRMLLTFPCCPCSLFTF